MENLALYVTTLFFGFFAMMNPFSSTTVFISLTEGMDSGDKKTVAFRAVLVGFIIVFAFILMGKLIFDLFGITLPAFRIAGGILLFITGMKMLLDENPNSERNKLGQKDRAGRANLDIAVSPLGIPILAGPSTIATAMNFVADRTTFSLIITSGIFLLLCIITYVFFISGHKLVKHLGENVIRVISRIMGMIIAVIGTQLVIAGILGVIQLGSK